MTLHITIIKTPIMIMIMIMIMIIVITMVMIIMIRILKTMITTIRVVECYK